MPAHHAVFVKLTPLQVARLSGRVYFVFRTRLLGRLWFHKNYIQHARWLVKRRFYIICINAIIKIDNKAKQKNTKSSKR